MNSRACPAVFLAGRRGCFHPSTKMVNSMPRKIISAFVILAFLATAVPVPGRAGEVFLPAPGVRMAVSPALLPPMILGLTVDAVGPMKFNFLIDQGDQKVPTQDQEKEFKQLIKYFLASLTIPEKDLWVNLSPYEGQRIIPQAFGQTEMGRDLLGQDYVLKQITASLIYPESELGKKFWADVYKKAHEQYGTTNIPVNTFNKVWIVPDEAMVYEHDGSAFVVKSHLKVMLEEDYLALQKSRVGAQFIASDKGLMNQTPTKDVNRLGSQVVREIVLPALEKEVNEGKNFALLRQINNALILATWYKRALKESLLGKFYVDKAKVKGVDHADRQANEKIYQRYLEAFKKGVYNFIKEDRDPYTQQTVPRKYFSGGFEGKYAQVVQVTRDQSQVSEGFIRRIKGGMDGRIVDVAMEAQDAATRDGAMISNSDITILVVDDDSDVRGMSKTILERQGYKVKEAQNGLEALEILQRQDAGISLVVSDIRMPEMDGLQLAAAIRDKKMRLPIILVSGTAGDADGLQNKNVVKVLVKPNGILRELVPAIEDNKIPETGQIRAISEDGAITPVDAAMIVRNVSDSARSTIARFWHGNLTDGLDIIFSILNGKNFGEAELAAITQEIGKITAWVEQERDKKSNGPVVRATFGTLSSGGKRIREAQGPVAIDYDLVKILNLYVLRGVQMQAFQDQKHRQVIAQEANRRLRNVFRLLLGLTTRVRNVHLWHGVDGTEFIDTTDPNLDLVMTALRTGNAPSSDQAMNAKDLGGIDLNPANLNLRIKRDGKGVPLPVGQQDMGQLNNIEGLMPVIIKIVPVTYIPALSDVLAAVN